MKWNFLFVMEREGQFAFSSRDILLKLKNEKFYHKHLIKTVGLKTLEKCP